MNSFDRFELEQQLLECWSLVDHLKTLNIAVLEQGLSDDKVSNILTGLIDLYNIKFDTAFSTFSQGVSQKRIT